MGAHPNRDYGETPNGVGPPRVSYSWRVVVA
jgi:hypothetical protein